MPPTSSVAHRPRRVEPARRVRDLLRSAIVRKGSPGDLLPSEAELILQYRVSRNAVREALDLLRREGLVQRVQGAGTFVLSSKARHRFDRLNGLSEYLPDGPARTEHRILERTLLPAPRIVAQELAIEPGAPTVFLERLLVLDGTPISLWSSYLPADLAAPLLDLEEAALRRDFYELVEGFLGLTVAGARISTEAVLADDSVALVLGMRPGAPLLLFERLAHLQDGRAIEFGYSRFRGDRLTLVSTIPRIDHCGANTPAQTGAYR